MKKLYWVSVILTLMLSCVSNQRDGSLATEYYNIGNAFYEVDLLVKASQYYEKALDINPNYHSARFNLIQTKIKQSDFKTANNHIEYLKEIDKENLEIKKLEAYVRYTEGNLRESLDLYLEVYQAGDISNETKLNIVKLYYQLELYDKALDMINSLLDGDDESLFYLAGLISIKADRTDLVLKYFEYYVELGGDQIDALTELAKIYRSQGSYDLLKQIINILIKNDAEENKGNYYFELSQIYLLEESNFSVGYNYLIDAIDSGFNSEEKALELLEEPDLIDATKIRQLFIDNNIL